MRVQLVHKGLANFVEKLLSRGGPCAFRVRRAVFIAALPKYIARMKNSSKTLGRVLLRTRPRVSLFDTQFCRYFLCAMVTSILTVQVIKTFPVTQRHVRHGPSARENLLKNNANPTFLLGIFTVLKDGEMRELIRRAYLIPNSAITCSLTYFLSTLNEECRVIYAFVVGGNPQGNPEHESSQVSTNISLDLKSLLNIHGSEFVHEEDIVYLNIRENMNEGKTATWFRYAAEIPLEYQVDYVSKLDSDTFLSLPSFLRTVDRDLPRRPDTGEDNRKLYGGILMEYNECGRGPHCLLLKGRAYMSGQFYFVSRDLAKYVTSSAVDRNNLRVGFEDFDFGLWVFSHPEAIKLFVLSGERSWLHNSNTKQRSWWASAGIPRETMFPQRNSQLVETDECVKYKCGNLSE